MKNRKLISVLSALLCATILCTMDVTTMAAGIQTYAIEQDAAVSLAKPVITETEIVAKGIKLTWEKVANATGYYVYRKTGSGSYTKVATVKGKETYTDKKANKSATKYTYKIYAYKGTKKSDPSKTVSTYFVPQEEITEIESSTSAVKLTWQTLARGISGYNIYKSVSGSSVAPSTTVSGSKPSITVSGSKDKAVSGSNSSTVSGSKPSTSVSGSNATTTTSKTSTYKKIKTITDPSVNTFTDKDAKVEGQEYKYVVEAFYTVGSKTYTGALSKADSTFFMARPTATLANTTSKKITVGYGASKVATGHEIEYSLDKDFKTDVKSKDVESKGKGAYTANTGTLKKGKTYYVRVRSYLEVGDETYYSAWSKVKKLKVTK